MKKIYCALLMTVGMINQSLSMQVITGLSKVRSTLFTTQTCASKNAPTLYVKYGPNYEDCVTVEKSSLHDEKQLDIFEGYHDWDGYSSWGKKVGAFQRIWETKSYNWKGAYRSKIIKVDDNDDEQHRVVELKEITTLANQKDVIEELIGLLELPNSVFEIPHIFYPEGDNQVKIPKEILKRCSDESNVSNMPSGRARTNVVYKDTKGKETKVIVDSYREGTVSLVIEGDDANQIPGYLSLLTEKNKSFSIKSFSWYSATADIPENRRLDIKENTSLHPSSESMTNPADNPCYQLVLKYLRQE